jgi:hypothetical protein
MRCAAAEARQLTPDPCRRWRAGAARVADCRSTRLLILRCALHYSVDVDRSGFGAGELHGLGDCRVRTAACAELKMSQHDRILKVEPVGP